MNIKDYISSGIVESYVLGLADEAERTEFESMSAKHDEVRAARDLFELSLEKQALVGAVMPPANVKAAIFATVSQTGASVADDNIADQGLEKSTAASAGSTGSSSKSFSQSADVATPARVISTSGWAKYLAAASVLLLVGSTILNFYLFNQYKAYSERYVNLLASQTQLANNNRALQTSVDTYRNTIAALSDPKMSIIKMVGTKVPNNGSPDPASMATIYWNKQSAEVYLMVNNLPKATSGKQYQLWAIVKGKPVSAGVFDINPADSVLKMNNMPAAEAFAVTLETTGGSESPKGAMYVLGAI